MIVCDAVGVGNLTFVSNCGCEAGKRAAEEIVDTPPPAAKKTKQQKKTPPPPPPKEESSSEEESDSEEEVSEIPIICRKCATSWNERFSVCLALSL